MIVDGRAGGGQLLRSALTLSLLTGQPFTIEGIRGSRPKPGLLRQHLTAVQAAALVGRARVEGAQLGSTALRFTPGEVRPGTFRLDIGSAGSTSLVLQTVALPLLRASGPSEVRITGGTHALAAPAFHYVDEAWGPFLRRGSAGLDLRLLRWGFFPRGGGEVVARISPGSLAPVAVAEVGDPVVHGHLAAPEPGVAFDRLRRRVGAATFHPVKDGAVAWIDVRWPGPPPGREQFTAFPQRKEPPEALVDRACAAHEAWAAAGAPVGEHLADQLLLPLALAGGRYRMAGESDHFRTNRALLDQFLPGRVHVAAGEVWADAP